MGTRLDDLFDYVQERCLWQFHSRAWDRTKNIEGVIGSAIELLAGRTPAAATPDERNFLADAKLMVTDFRSRFPWIREAGEPEILDLMGGLRDRLLDVVVTRSRNRELTHSLY